MLALSHPEERVRISAAETGDLQLDVVLIRPEPGRWIVVLTAAKQGARCMLRLVDGVLHRLEPRAFPTPGKIRAVAHCEDIGGGGAAEAVDGDAIVDAE